MTREYLFIEATLLFGPGILMTNSIRNPGSLKTQEDVEKTIRETHKHIQRKRDELAMSELKIMAWLENLKESFISGELNK